MLSLITSSHRQCLRNSFGLTRQPSRLIEIKISWVYIGIYLSIILVPLYDSDHWSDYSFACAGLGKKMMPLNRFCILVLYIYILLENITLYVQKNWQFHFSLNSKVNEVKIETTYTTSGVINIFV